MTLVSELQQGLSKIQASIGDVEVVLKAAEQEAETVVKSFEVSLSPTGSATGSAVTIVHGTADPAPPTPEPVEPSNAGDTPPAS